MATHDTETADARYVDIDDWPTEAAVAAMLEGQMSAIASLANQTAALARAAEAAAALLLTGGRLVYVGAGTSLIPRSWDRSSLAPGQCCSRGSPPSRHGDG